MNLEIKKNWDDMAQAYEDFTETEDSYSYAIEWPTIRRLLPDLNGKRILDLGCGTGRFSFLFEQENPATILGIDVSESMLDIAQKKGIKQESIAQFIQGDLEHIDQLSNNTYDFIFSSTTFHYIHDINTLFHNIYNLLETNGCCIISLMNPIYTAQYPIDKGDEFPTDDEWVVRYLDKRKRAYIQPWIEYNDNIQDYLSKSYHHTMGDYLNAIINAGFIIEKVEEPLPPEHWKVNNPRRYDAFIQTPSFIIFRLSK